MSDIIEFKVNGWPLALLDGKPDARIQDEELGRRAGLAQPRNIRTTIKKLQKRGRLAGIESRIVVMRQPVGPKGGGTREFKVETFWLNRTEALKVVNALETPMAEAMQDEMIHVFELALDGKLPGQNQVTTVADPRIDQLITLQLKQGEQIAELQRKNNAIITVYDHKEMRALVAVVADYLVQLGRAGKAAHFMVDRKLTKIWGHGGAGHPWHTLPATKVDDVIRFLRDWRDELKPQVEEANRCVSRQANERQRKFDFSKPN